ncbi:hypothetical protein ACWKSP_22145 [Micromonosporaceae bacterium Da 78-11]
MTDLDRATRIHSCGDTMFPAVLSKHSPTPQYRSQPVWLCGHCANDWEPREGWDGQLPAAWDATANQWVAR